MTTNNRILTIEETANYLSMSQQTLADWRCDGTGPRYIKFGRTVRYDLADIHEWLESNKRENTSQQSA